MTQKLHRNPSTGRLARNPVTGKLQRAVKFADDDCCCFLEPGTPGDCDNTGWDSYPPYGGPGKTPLVYSVTITDMPEGIFAGPNAGTLLPEAFNKVHSLPSGLTVFFCDSWRTTVLNATTNGYSAVISIDLFNGDLLITVFDVQSRNVVVVRFDQCEIFGTDIQTPAVGGEYTIEWNPE